MNNKDVSRYQRIWRWHFYAGLFVAPFLILLSLTGIIYLFQPQLDRLMYAELQTVTPGLQRMDADFLVNKAHGSLPGSEIVKYIPAPAPDRSDQLVVRHQGQELTLFIDPIRGTLLGSQDNQYNLQAMARALHADLMLGTTGDRLIELAAGWGLVLIGTGLYLWWPRKGPGMQGLLWPRRDQKGRLWWRDMHAVVGFWGAGFLILLLLTGMTWTGFWGDKFAGVWNRFPAQMWNQVPTSTPLTRTLNHAHEQTVPWAVETLPMPESATHDHSAMGHAAGPAEPGRISWQQVVETASGRQVQPGYSITPPAGSKGVFTLSVFADDPRNDATLHLDQYSGKVLADVRWQDYGPVAKAVETGVMLHMGKMYGWPHQLAMLLICLMILLSSVSGLWIWWRRRPAGRLGVPPLPSPLPSLRGALVLLILLGLAFPLVGASMLVIWLLDSLLLTRLGAPLARLR
ncbi:PepSY-associated TM helix domain-containing protein [Aeromonas bivalvium]|uniref:PepSY-associated TM helix domain-containing protein n=1 Tax=Aeromonas bivalvium TaxID=440079 RepID=UPI00370C5DCC